jgi:hypothetical protein
MAASLFAKMGRTEQPVNWVRVKSKMLAAVAYNPDWQQLYLKYRSGDVYCYWSVPFQSMKSFLPPSPKASMLEPTF